MQLYHGRNWAHNLLITRPALTATPLHHRAPSITWCKQIVDMIVIRYIVIWTTVSLFIVQSSGITCHTICGQPTYHWPPSDRDWKHFCSTLTCSSAFVTFFCEFGLYKWHYYYYDFWPLTPVLDSQGRKIMLCKDKIRKQAGMVFTAPPPSQNYQEVE